MVTHPLTGGLVSITLFFLKMIIILVKKKKRKQAMVERCGESDQQKLAKKIMSNQSYDLITARC